MIDDDCSDTWTIIQNRLSCGVRRRARAAAARHIESLIIIRIILTPTICRLLGTIECVRACAARASYTGVHDDADDVYLAEWDDDDDDYTRTHTHTANELNDRSM